MIQSNSKIFTTALFGIGTNDTTGNLVNKNLTTQQEYLGSSMISNLGTRLPRVPSNQRVAKDTYDIESTRIFQTFIITSVPNPEAIGNIFAVDGVNKPTLSFVRGGVYTFDQSDPSNIGHPLRFKDSTDALYTIGVAVSGIPGQAGAQTVITVSVNAPENLRYFCTVHGNGMGNIITVTGGVVSSILPSNRGSTFLLNLVPSGGGSSGGGSSGGGSSPPYVPPSSGGGGSSGGGY